MRNRVWGLIATGVALFAIGATLLNVCAFYAPKSAAGWMRFRWEYDSANDKSAYLDTFRTRIGEHGGGYIPDDVARFLCGRLESSADADEVAAVTRFFSEEAGGREPGALFGLSDKARRRVAHTVLRDWKTYRGEDAQHGFVLLEGLRRNTWLGKADVILPNNDWADSPAKLAPVARLFEKWDSKYSVVPFTKRPNPLVGTPYRIEGV